MKKELTKIEKQVQARTAELLSVIKAQFPKRDIPLFFLDGSHEVCRVTFDQCAQQSRKTGFKPKDAEPNDELEFFENIIKSDFEFEPSEKPMMYSKKICINILKKDCCKSFKYFIVTNSLRLLTLYVNESGSKVEIMLA